MTPESSAVRPTLRLGPEVNPTCEDTQQTTSTVEPVTKGVVTPRPLGGARGRIGRLRERISPRDEEILKSLGALRLMTGNQIERLHFVEGSPATRGRRCRAALKRLAELKLIVRLGRRIGGMHAGSAGYVIGLSGYGQAVIDNDGPMGGRRRKIWETKPKFTDHVLAVAEIYVGLREAERTETLELLEFQAEPACWRQSTSSHGQPLTVKPDAFVRLGVADLELSSFIEVDMGTESPATLSKKMQAYIAYWRTGIEQQRHGVFPRVWWLGNSSRAHQRIVRVLQSLPLDTQHLFGVALLADATSSLTFAAKEADMNA
ncbi:replication-relaxation family protein [Allorhizocola rhizosphaerae]|uniref:replication-relaxation family protein n=1 Tax=Allorhizocola rhizosphaerae TaxID=1872709 RepID=UPI000E3C1544|nr:replication-relaxation family protein [Allorhizocola rhizosphaerae]